MYTVRSQIAFCLLKMNRFGLTKKRSTHGAGELNIDKLILLGEIVAMQMNGMTKNWTSNREKCSTGSFTLDCMSIHSYSLGSIHRFFSLSFAFIDCCYQFGQIVLNRASFRLFPHLIPISCWAMCSILFDFCPTDCKIRQDDIW